MKIEEYSLLKNYSNYHIGGPARYFCEVSNENDLREAITFANNNHLQIFILGGGTNLLISDKGFNGLVIKIQDEFHHSFGMSRFKIQDSSINVGAGFDMQELVRISVDAGLAGLEWAGGLPGTVGGAIFGNAGCFGWEIKSVIKSVQAVKITTYNLQPTTYNLNECDFSYRLSKFKKEGDWVILSATLQLQQGDREELRKATEEKIAFRKNRHPLEYPNIGSIFKNIHEKENVRKIVMYLPAIQSEVNEKWHGKIPAALLIQKAGLQGKQIGGAEVSEKHANFIVNKDNARAEDVKMLIGEIKKTIKKLFDTELEEEVRYVGF